MKQLNATAAGDAAAPIDACYDRLADVEAYPNWHPAGVKRAHALEHDSAGAPTKVSTTFVLQRLQRDFAIEMAVRLERPHLVELRRLPKKPGDTEQVILTWRLTERGADRTAITLDLEAALDLPRFLPIGGVGDTIARGFLEAAVASFAGQG
jgi:hypothetical protein